MKKLLLILLLFSSQFNFAQRLYDENNPEESYIDLDTKSAKLQYDNYVISGTFEEFVVDYTNYYRVINGGDIHLVLKQYTSLGTQTQAFWLVKGNYKDAVKITKKEQVPKKLELIAYDKAERYFKDYFNFLSERFYNAYLLNKSIVELIKEYDFIGVYDIEIKSSLGINLLAEEPGKLYITEAGMTLESQVPGIITLRGAWNSEFGNKLERIKTTLAEDGRLEIVGELSTGYGDTFSISMTKDAVGLTTFYIDNARGAQTHTAVIKGKK